MGERTLAHTQGKNAVPEDAVLQNASIDPKMPAPLSPVPSAPATPQSPSRRRQLARMETPPKPEDTAASLNLSVVAVPGGRAEWLVDLTAAVAKAFKQMRKGILS